MVPRAQDTLANQDDISSLIISMRDWFTRKDVEETIQEAATTTFNWLIENRENYDEIGYRKKGSWWISLPRTEDRTVIMIRQLGLVDKVYEHGWRFMLEALSAKGVINEPSNDVFELLSFDARGLLNELVLDARVDGEEKSLRDLARRYGINPTKFRNRTLVRLASQGAVLARYSDGYGIVAGPIASAFVTNVLTPTVEKFETEVEGSL